MLHDDLNDIHALSEKVDEALIDSNWDREYERSKAAYPVDSLYENKYWPPVGRVDNVYGDRNLVCSCPSMEDYD